MARLLFYFLLFLLHISAWSLRLPAWKCGRHSLSNTIRGTSYHALRPSPAMKLAMSNADIDDVHLTSEYEKSVMRIDGHTCASANANAEEKPIPKLITGIIDNVLTYSTNNKDLSGFDPNVLLESAHIITTGRIYESLMNDRMEAAREGSGENLAQLEKVDALLQGFVTAERKQRARLKVTYVLAGAESGRLNEGITLLSESGEIDDDLMKYLDRIIRKEFLKAMGPGATLNEDGDSIDPNRAETEEESLDAGVKATLSVLRMVQKLLQAELKTEKRAEVRLLSALLEEKDPEARYVRIKTALTKIEQLEEFAAFLTEGIAYLKTRQSTTRSADAQSDSHREAEAARETQLPAGVVEQMKDILLDVQAVLAKLKTGMLDGDVYSTDKGDYADKSPYQ